MAAAMKVAICTPYHGTVTGEYAFSLAEMAMRSVRTPVRRGDRTGTPELRIFALSSSRLARARNEIMRAATAWGAEFLLWIDSDQSFPDDTLLRLLSLDLAVVGANIPRRTQPTGPTASRDTGAGRSPVYSTSELAAARAVEQVDGLGLGCTLVDMAVIRAIAVLAEREGRATVEPLFADVTAADPRDDVGEDRYFFEILKRAGVPVHVDHWLSRRVGHVFETILTHRDVDAQRDAFLGGQAPWAAPTG